MKNQNSSIKLTEHAKRKMIQRNISFEDIVSVVCRPEYKEQDKIDDTLIHLIGKINRKYLRITRCA